MSYKFYTISEAAKETGNPPFRIRAWILSGKIRYNKAGNRYLINLDWFHEDFERMAEENMSSTEEDTQIGSLRRVKI